MIYEIGIYLYAWAVRLAALFNVKPRKMVKGHQEAYKLLRERVDPKARYLWFHAASLGEFEQGRPLMEKMRAAHPEYKILLTFFSPSGYEVRKNYSGADIICYLPFDTSRNVKKFFRLIQPYQAFFIKYEFWKNYLEELYRQGIPVYSISSVFREEQVFFKLYGRMYRNVLTYFDHLFVQNEISKQLLARLGITTATVVGDTRFDRVLQIKAEAKELPLVEKFKGQSITLVAGSSWGPDEDLFIEYFNTRPELKLILAPHVVNEKHLAEITAKLKRPFVRYTTANEQNIGQAHCLIINCYGLLSSIYRYGEIAYIGGGFGVSIHNTLEAAVYGVPVLFGPNYKKFPEAVQLIETQAAFSVTSYEELKNRLDKLLSDASFLTETGSRAGRYVLSRAGATDKILKMIQ